MNLFILCVIVCALLKIPAAHMSGETSVRQEHGIYTDLSKREPGMIARCLYSAYSTVLERTFGKHRPFLVYVINSYSTCITCPLLATDIETS
jgi:hypothetical protein